MQMKRKERKIRPNTSNICFEAATNTEALCAKLTSVIEATSERECLKKSNTIDEL